MVTTNQIDAQRRAQRTYGQVLEADVRFAGGITPTRLFATDISDGGAFVECANPPNIGTIVELHIALPGGETLFSRARVVHALTAKQKATDPAIPGMGIQFIDISGSERQKLASALGSKRVTRRMQQTEAPASPAKHKSLPPVSRQRRLTPKPHIAMLAAMHEKRATASTAKNQQLAEKLLKAAQEALDEGLIVQAGAQLQIALGYAPENPEIKRLARTVIPEMNQRRAERAWLQGLHFETIGDLDRATESYREALALNPENPNYHRKLAELAVERADLSAAREHIGDAIRAMPRDPELYLFAADIYAACNERQLALLSAKRAQQYAPNRKDIREHIRQLKRRRTTGRLITPFKKSN